MQTFLALQDWGIGGHALPPPWLRWIGWGWVALLAAGYAFLLARSFLRAPRYRALDVLSEADLAVIHEALVAAERRTLGEILPVVLERSDRHPGAAWLAALTCALVGTAALAPWLGGGDPVVLVGVQLALGALGYASARALPGFQRSFLGEARATEMAEEQAFQEFHRHDLAHTAGRTGVLLFVSLLEQRAIVLADDGIDARVEPDTWRRTNEALLEGVRRGSLRDGLMAGIQQAGEVLARHFPCGPEDRNEVPDRVIVRAE